MFNRFPQRFWLRLVAVAIFAALSGCLGLIDGYVLEPVDMGEREHVSRADQLPPAGALRTIGVINPFRLQGRADFVCVGRDGQYVAERMHEALAARVITIDLPPGLSDAVVERSLASWSDAELSRALDMVVVPDAFVFGSVHEEEYVLVPFQGYESTITYDLRLLDRRGRPLWQAHDRRRGLVYETPVDAADRLVASLRQDLGLAARAPEGDRP